MQTRCEILGVYLIENHSTIRNTASHFNMTKTTVHRDVSKVLKHTNPSLYSEVHALLEQNYNEKHIRGGLATRKKYKLRFK